MGFLDDINFSIIGDQAYTEDNILVYNIFVYKIPKKVTEDEALEYFSKFGGVNKLRFAADKRRSRRSAPKVGFVYFANATSAAMVLQQHSPHIIKSKQVRVKACDSWNQPAAITLENLKKNPVDLDLQSLILQLNDDCLVQIFKKLTLKDQVSFLRACQRFRNVFEIASKSEHKEHVFDHLAPLTLWEIRDFFKFAGPNIESTSGLVPYKFKNRIFEFITKFCHNINRITLHSCKFKTSILHKLFDKLQNVTVLEFEDCSFKDASVLVLKKLRKLETLMLRNNYELTGKYMDLLITVKELILHGCRNIQSTHFIKICKSIKGLQSLDIQYCDSLSSAALSEMVGNCHNLELLKISCTTVPIECVARLPCLKHLEIIAVSEFNVVRQQLFIALAEHKFNQLESLKIDARNCVDIECAEHIAQLTHLQRLICGNNENIIDVCLRKFGALQNLQELVIYKCPKITNAGLLDLLRKCTKLKKVNIEHCVNISDLFVLEAIKLLESTHNQRGKEPCLFLVDGTSINRYMLNNAKYLAASAFIKLSFNSHLTRGPSLISILDGENEYLDFDDDFDDDFDHDFYENFEDNFDNDFDENFEDNFDDDYIDPFMDPIEQLNDDFPNAFAYLDDEDRY